MQLKKRLTKRFTLIELLAVIAISAMLLTIGLKVMKTDSTKANAAMIGNALKYAQSYAMSNLDSANTLGNNGNATADSFADEYIKVFITQSTGAITITKSSQDTGYTDVIIYEERMAVGSQVDQDYTLGFRNDGSPITTGTNNTQTTMSAQTTITITHNKNTDVTQIVKLKPFTGKVTYY